MSLTSLPLVLLTRFSLYCTLILMSQLGVLIRLSLTNAFLASSLYSSTSSLDSAVPGLHVEVFSNILGCFLMGFFVSQKALIEKSPIISSPTLYIALTTGLCGSITTFSGWMVAAGRRMLSNLLADWIFVILTGFCLSFSSLVFGTHVGKYLAIHLWKLNPEDATPIPEDNPRVLSSANFEEPTRPPTLEVVLHSRVDLGFRAFSVLTAVIFTSLCVLLAFILPNSQDEPIWIAGCLGPLGTILRFELGQFNKLSLFSSFPAFTLLSNLIASAISFGLEFTGKKTSHLIWADALILGFCGCLSTVSSFINEIKGQKRLQKYVYGFTSVALTQFLLFLVWTIFRPRT